MSDVWEAAASGDAQRLKELITRQGVSVNAREEGVSASFSLQEGRLTRKMMLKRRLDKLLF